MGARYNVTNNAKGPRGYREEGKTHPTTVQPGETATLILDESGENRLKELQGCGLVTLSRLADLPADPDPTLAGEPKQPPAPAPALASADPGPTAEDIAAAAAERDRLAKDAADLAAETDRKNAGEADEQARADAAKLAETKTSTEGGEGEGEGDEDEDEEVILTEPEFTDEQIESWKPELLRSYITEKTGEAPAASCNTKTLINKAKAAAAPKPAAPAPEEAV